MMKYVCSSCRKKNVKLWREYNTFANRIKLYCLGCACKDQNKIRTPTEDGKSLYTERVHHWFRTPAMFFNNGSPRWQGYNPDKDILPENAEFYSERDRTDQIGWLVPAVPTEDGSFWGYTSVPPEACEWWYKLPY